MAKRNRKTNIRNKHAALYEWERRTPAYQSLNLEARCLLMELRLLYNGADNRVYMSVRQAMQRMGVGQRRAQRAIDELVDRGFIMVLSPGQFSAGTYRRATEYALLNVPLDNESTARKPYATWGKSPPKATPIPDRKYQLESLKVASS